VSVTTLKYCLQTMFAGSHQRLCTVQRFVISRTWCSALRQTKLIGDSSLHGGAEPQESAGPASRLGGIARTLIGSSSCGTRVTTHTPELEPAQTCRHDLCHSIEQMFDCQLSFVLEPIDRYQVIERIMEKADQPLVEYGWNTLDQEVDRLCQNWPTGKYTP
jgi:hypothetical protein